MEIHTHVTRRFLLLGKLCFLFAESLTNFAVAVLDARFSFTVARACMCPSQEKAEEKLKKVKADPKESKFKHAILVQLQFQTEQD